MDALASERAMTWSEPNIYASRDYVTSHQSERPTDTGRWWQAGERFTISIKSPGQNEFFDVNKMRLQFSVLSTVLPPATGANNIINKGQINITTDTQESGLPMGSSSDAGCMLPGVPAWGCPFFSSVRVSIPGLPIESFLTTDVESQMMIATRLLCASGPGSWDPKIGKITFKIGGEAELAGARSVVDRANCVSVNNIRSDRGVAITDHSGEIRTPGYWGIQGGLVVTRGCVTHYSIPLSLFSHLFNQASNLLPLAFYSTASDTCTFTFEVAPISSAVNNVNADLPDLVGPTNYYLIDPAISYTKLLVSNPALLASIEQLFRGVTAVPIAPGVSVPIAMVMKFINYFQALGRVPNTSGYFNISIPANQPSCRGLAVRFTGENPTNAGLRSLAAGTLAGIMFTRSGYVGNDVQPNIVYSATAAGGQSVRWNFKQYSGAVGSTAANGSAPQWNGKYLLQLRPQIRNFQLRIASYRVPLDPLWDSSLAPGVVPRSLLTSDPFVGMNALLTANYPSANPYVNTSPDNLVQDDVPPDYNGSGPDTGFILFPAYQPLQTDLSYISREGARLYKAGKHLFSPFASEEHPHEHALAPFFMNPIECGTASAGAKLFCDSHIKITGYDLAGENANTGDLRRMGNALRNSARVVSGQGAFRYYSGEDFLQSTGGSVKTSHSAPMGYGASKVPLPYWCDTGLFVLPFETLPPVYNHRDDAFSLRGLDLRSITSMELSGEILGVTHGEGAGDWGMNLGYNDTTNTDASVFPQVGNQPQGTMGAFYTCTPANNAQTMLGGPSAITVVNGITQYPQQDGVFAQTWTVRVLMAYDHEHVLLPGRTDAEAQFSLIPTGNTAIPSGGAAAM